MVLKELASGCSDEDIQRVIAAADANHDGLIDFQEFVAWVFGDPHGSEQLEMFRVAEVDPLPANGGSTPTRRGSSPARRGSSPAIRASRSPVAKRSARPP